VIPSDTILTIVLILWLIAAVVLFVIALVKTIDYLTGRDDDDDEGY